MSARYRILPAGRAWLNGCSAPATAYTPIVPRVPPAEFVNLGMVNGPDFNIYPPRFSRIFAIRP